MSDDESNRNPQPSTKAAAGSRSPDAAASGRLSEELHRLIGAFAERSVRLREVLEVMHGRGYTMLLILLTFPFCTPIPLPGLSAPFGLAVALVGFRLALGQKPWLPDRLLDMALPPKFFPRVLSATRRLIGWLERFLKPRLSHILRWRLVRHVMGTMIFVCGLLMMLPFPIPFSNGLPAMTVLFLAAATLEKDGYVAVAGGILFAVTLGFFAAVAWGGTEIVNLLKDTLGDFLKPDDAPAEP